MRIASLVALFGMVIGLFSAPLSANADESALIATTTTITGPARYEGQTVNLDVGVVAADSTPLAGAAVTLERRLGGVWRPVADATTGANGHVAIPATMSRVASDNTFRARYAGDQTHAASVSAVRTITLLRRATRMGFSAPLRVVDETYAVFKVLWRTPGGIPVHGEVRIQQLVGKRWVARRTMNTDAAGRATWNYKVRSDSRWRAVGIAGSWAKGAISGTRTVDNRPPGVPFRMPRGAPSPRIKLPAQPRATQPGAAVTVSPISHPIWRQMVGRSWHSGCPVGRSGLRLIRVNYWAYDGYRRRGEMVVNARVAGNVAGALKAMYDGRHPIRAMYRVDRFGWSSVLHGGNDYRSMAAGNTSAFNCRNVVNSPGVKSPHSWGTAVDVNTWENPYRSRTGLVPNSWWHYHPSYRVSWRSTSHPVVQLMRRHGLRWTYGNGDTQHFDATAGAARILIAPRCVGECH
ncbi:M15 family metallopeptidase [Nocardioides jensenii]|uniref:M15 family metallopeptidase n=1 Tax=Nocardioides jensenii TaxID=1843 RepID=UPI000836F36B|nr:M15 family metallopeptidase [Nocardioides jensenii]